MRTMFWAGAIATVVAGTALGQVPSSVTYTVELGGNNYVADWEAASIITTAFTPGLASDGQTFSTSPVTWDVVAAVAGNDGTGFNIQGAANLTFNVELQDANGNAVPGNRFFSTMNDGDDQGLRRAGMGIADPFEKAAFCLGWDVDLDLNGVLDGVFGPATGDPGNPGRLFDPPTAAGPGMDRAQFPSNKFHGGGRLKGSDTNYWRDCNGNNPGLALTDLNGDGRKDDLDEIMATPAIDADLNGIIDACEAGSVSLAGTVGEPLAENKLSGMGLGYSEFKLGSNDRGVGLAVGSGNAAEGGLIGIGAKPVAEGQINMTGLPTGTYKLVISVPANSNNVIPMDYVPTAGGAGGFAIKPASVVTDEIVFNWIGQSVTPVAPIAWQSVRLHGTPAVARAIDLNPAAAYNAETRNGGVQQIKVQFDGNLSNANYAAGGVVVVGGLVVSGEALATTAITNDTLVLTVTGSADKTCYKVNVAGACSLKGTADPDCVVAALAGDVTGDKVTNLIDMSQVKPLNGSSAAGFVKYDINTDDVVNLIDMSLVKGWNGNNIAVCP